MRAGLLLRRAGLAASGLELLLELCSASEVTASCSSPQIPPELYRAPHSYQFSCGRATFWLRPSLS